MVLTTAAKTSRQNCESFENFFLKSWKTWEFSKMSRENKIVFWSRKTQFFQQCTKKRQQSIFLLYRTKKKMWKTQIFRNVCLSSWCSSVDVEWRFSNRAKSHFLFLLRSRKGLKKRIARNDINLVFWKRRKQFWQQCRKLLSKSKHVPL